MNETKLTFKRTEKKYLLTPENFEALWRQIGAHLEPDDYPKSTVCSIYYDTDDYRLIRNSIEGPVYKEKLRLRSYRVPGPEDPVFVELKKKFKGVVYKRRVSLPAQAAEDWLDRGIHPREDSQMIREIDWFLHSVQPGPKAMLACDRDAWRDKADPELRITFDRELRWREEDLHLSSGAEGEALLPEGYVLMEIKTPTAAPLWLAHSLSELRIFPVSFSKYGTCYKEHILQEYFFGGSIHA